MVYKKWTPKEEGFLRENYGNMKTKDIAKALNRDVPSIQRKCNRLGLRMDKSQYTKATGKIKWTDDMRKLVKENYNKIPIEDIAWHLGIDDTSAIRKQARALGCVEELKPWTKEEEDYLELVWGTYSIESISKKLGVSYEAVRQKAHRMRLGNQHQASGDLPVAVAATALGVNKRTIYRWIKIGLLKYKRLKIGKTFRYIVKIEHLADFMKNNQDKYDTRKCDRDLLRSILTDYKLLKETIEITELPDWLKDKIKSDDEKVEDVKKRREWTIKEIEKALNLKKKGLTHEKIGRELGRTKYSIDGFMKKHT